MAEDLEPLQGNLEIGCMLFRPIRPLGKWIQTPVINGETGFILGGCFGHVEDVRRRSKRGVTTPRLFRLYCQIHHLVVYLEGRVGYPHSR